MPWAQTANIFNGGQMWALHHCLYLNKMIGTEWVFFIDVDEFLVEGRNFSGTKNLPSKILATQKNISDIYSFTFGQFIAEPRIKFENEESFLKKFAISETPFEGTRVLSNSGRRKQLLRVKYACELRVHGGQKDRCRGDKIVFNIRTYHFANVHISGLQRTYGKYIE